MLRSVPTAEARTRRRAPTLALVFALLAAATLPGSASGQQDASAAGGADVLRRTPPMQHGMDMRLGLGSERPSVTPWLPGEGIDPSTLPEAEPNRVLRLADGDTLDLTAGLVRRELRGKTVVMYAFNRQYPGPLIRVKRDATIIVRFHNRL
ncbi:MAG TPA: multicopper oxidase domain-containing protein, partial [Gemmatimonadota bacterium]|nr:multicopper oxidase domain-containing protein [Gemmatimonadota bacterium]